VSLETWLLFCATETVLCFTPGPAVLLVVSLTLSRGGAAGLGASLGILAANTAYFVLSATSLGAVLLASYELFSLIKWLGAAYLVWLGLRMIAGAFRRTTIAPDPAGEAPRPSRRLGAFPHGFVTQGANPKSLLFFGAILPQFIDTARPVAFQVAVLGVSSVVIELAVLSLYVAACRHARGWARQPRTTGVLQTAGGALLVVAGARLAAIRPG
jgi:threonine/homoserine/homoserine lactone efflux protein